MQQVIKSMSCSKWGADSEKDPPPIQQGKPPQALSSLEPADLSFSVQESVTAAFAFRYLITAVG